MTEKKYYWLKLQKDFFASKRIKKLRRLAGGDTYTIIYLKMQLLSLDKGGLLEYTGLENTFAEELALDIDEDADNVKVTIQYLLSCGLIETSDNNEFLLPYVVENTASETKWAEKKRLQRQKKDEQRTIEGQCPIDIDIEKDIDIDIEKDIYIGAKSKRFVPPTLEEVQNYCFERNNNIDAEYFIDYYSTRNWELAKGRKVKDWKACVRTWEKNGYSKKDKDNKNLFDELKNC